MSYVVEELEAGKALERIADYKYAIVYLMSDLRIDVTEELEIPDWSECLEARFFDEEKELHIYEEDGCMRAVAVRGTLDDDCLVKKYELKERKELKGKRILCVCEHLEYDDDGQACVALTRLTGIE